jgi:subtilisin family serine protease
MAAKKLSVTGFTTTLAAPIITRPEDAGFSVVPATGNGIKLCLIDSGVVDHEAIVNIGGHINFTSDETYRDFVGHSTIVSGLIAANKPDHIQGVAPDGIIYYAKATSDKRESQLNAVVASMLWGIVKEANVILIPTAIQHQSAALQETINKAYESDICVVMAAADGIEYARALAVSVSGEPKVARFSSPLKVAAPGDGFGTTYLEQTYATASGLPVAAALVAGVCMLTCESLLKENKGTKPDEVFKRLAESVIEEKKQC